jgi:hypothetical protein
MTERKTKGKTMEALKEIKKLFENGLLSEFEYRDLIEKKARLARKEIEQYEKGAGVKSPQLS